MRKAPMSVGGLTAAWLGHTTSVMTDYYFTSGARQRENALALLDAEMARCNA